MTRLDRFQQGFAAIAAIFLVVVLAALGAFMLTFSNTQQLTSAQDIQGSRAYWAARAGLEWGVAKVASTTPACAASTPLTTAFDGGFSVTVDCSFKTYTDSSPVTIFSLTATAKPGGGVAIGSMGYIERSLSATVEMPIP
jgi:MSHA biogenesis protein MshP